jgi:uncharacterized protein
LTLTPELIGIGLGLIALGALTGFFAGLLGIGGGLIMVPCIHYLLVHAGVADAITMHIAIGTSLLVIIPTGLMSARAHAKRGNFDRSIFNQMAPGILVGVILGAGVADLLPTQDLKIVFAGVTALIAFTMFTDPTRFRIDDHMPSRIITTVCATIFGALASLMGVAGGAMNTPYMTLFNVPIHRAVATSAALGVVLAIPGAIGYALIGQGATGLPPFSIGYLSLPIAALLLPGSMMLAPFGARTAQRLPVKRLRLFFAIFVLIVSAKMAADGLGF